MEEDCRVGVHSAVFVWLPPLFLNWTMHETCEEDELGMYV